MEIEDRILNDQLKFEQQEKWKKWKEKFVTWAPRIVIFGIAVVAIWYIESNNLMYGITKKVRVLDEVKNAAIKEENLVIEKEYGKRYWDSGGTRVGRPYDPPVNKPNKKMQVEVFDETAVWWIRAAYGIISILLSWFTGNVALCMYNNYKTKIRYEKPDVTKEKTITTTKNIICNKETENIKLKYESENLVKGKSCNDTNSSYSSYVSLQIINESESDLSLYSKFEINSNSSDSNWSEIQAINSSLMSKSNNSKASSSSYYLTDDDNISINSSSESLDSEEESSKKSISCYSLN